MFRWPNFLYSSLLKRDHFVVLNLTYFINVIIFRNGIPIGHDSCKLLAADLANIQVHDEVGASSKEGSGVDNRETKENKPRKDKPTTSKKKEIPKVEKKVVLLKRGNQQDDFGLSNDMSKSTIISETKPQKVKTPAPINLDMLPRMYYAK